MKRILLAAISVGLFGAGLLSFGLTSITAQENDLALVGGQPQPASLKADDQPSNDFLILEGAQLSLIENVRLSTRDPGVVESVLVREGQEVAADEVVATLDQEMFAAQRNAAQSELEIASQETKNDVDLQYAIVSTAVNKKVLERSRDAVSQYAKAISSTELERLDLELKRSTFSREQAERTLEVNRLTEGLKAEELAIAELRLKNRQLKSPVTGTVVEIFRQPGEWLNTGEPIARIVNLQKLRVKCLIDARTINHDMLGSDANFLLESLGKEISVPAKVVFVSPEIDPVEQDFAIWAEVDNSDKRLKAGMVGKLKIATK